MKEKTLALLNCLPPILPCPILPLVQKSLTPSMRSPESAWPLRFWAEVVPAPKDNGWSTKWERWVEWICSNKIVVQLLLAQVTLLSRPKLLGQTANCTLSLSMLLRGWCLFLFLLLHPVRNGHLQQVLQSRYDSSLSCKAITQVRNCRTSDLAEVDEELVVVSATRQKHVCQ